MGADLIAVGSRGRGPIESLLGSVSAEVVGHASCPVLVAGAGPLHASFSPTDGSEQAYRAEDIVATWPVFDGARVDVISVAEGDLAWEDSLVVPFAP